MEEEEGEGRVSFHGSRGIFARGGSRHGTVWRRVCTVGKVSE